MPTFHPIDGSGGGPSGGGSRGPGTSRRQQGGASPSNPAANPYLTRNDAVASLQRQYANRRLGPTKGVMRVFDALSTPAYAIGALASGDPGGALRNLYTVGQSGPKITLSRSPLFKRILPDNALGTGLGLGIDILTDPLTYLTGGAGGVARSGTAKAARGAAERAARESAERVIARGAPLTLAERADVSARIAAELARVPGGIRVGIRVPFSRGRTLTAPLLSSEDRVARGAANIARRLRTSDKGRTVGGWAHSGGAALPEVNRVAQDLRRLASIEERKWTRRANDLQRRAFRVERQAGLKRGELLTGISHHLENPMRVNLPRAKAGTPAAVSREIDRIADDARAMLDELGAQEVAAGISRGEVENYVPHLLASEKDRKAFERAMGPRDLDPAVADSPFFTKSRQFESLDQMAAAGAKAGFTPETNIARIIQVRARASIRAQAKKALDDSVHGVHGKRLAPDPIPEVGPAAVRAVDERGALEDLLNPEGISAAPEGGAATAVATAEATRVEARAKVATARKAYATARASGDESRIVPARAALRKAERQERKASLAVAAARNGHTDLPGRVKAQLKATHKAERKLAVAEKKAGAARVLNAQAEARKGRPVTAEEYAHAAETWREVKGALKYNEGTLLPPDIATSLERAYEIIDPAVRMEARGPFLSFMRNLTGRWKSLALLSPGYHTRNMIDDGLRMWFAGARNPNTFAQSLRVLTRGTGTVKIKGRTYTAAEIRALAESEGVIGTGHTFSEVISTGDDLTARRVRGPGRGPATRFSQKFGDLREDSSRLFLFMEMLKRGEHAHEAGRITRWFLFDYGEVGRFVNSARNFWAPFLTYPSKALPQTIKLFATRPGIAANLNKTFMALEDLAGGPLDRSELPPWMEDALLVPSTPLLRSIIGAPTDQPLLLDPSRVTGYATLGMLDPTREGLARTAGETLHPALGFGAMQVFGFDTFKGRQMFPDERVYQPWVIQRLAELGVPIAGAGPKRDSYSGNTYPGYSPYLDSLLNLLPIFGQAGRTIPTDRSSSSRLGPFKFFTGLPISPLDRAKNAYWAQRFGRDGG